MGSLWQDIRYALRMMAKTPALTAVLAITLALGIGASTTIFSVVNSVVLRPLPYEQPDRIVRVYTEFLGPSPHRKFWFSIPELMELTRDCRSCALVGGWVRGSAPLAGGDRPVRVAVAYSTHQLLPLLGVSPVLGRWFDASEDRPQPPTPGQIVGEPSVVVISYDVWQRAFGGDKRIIGRKVELDAIPVTVIGVMPKGFDFLDGIEAWVPGHFDPALPRRASHVAHVVVRLAPGATLASLNEELASLNKEWGKRDTDGFHSISDAEHPMMAVPFQADLVGSLATTLWLLQGAVLFVLLISIVNVANLLLARAETRTREVAVRHALGASRRRLVRQFVTESLVLGIVGGALGILVSVWAIDGVTMLVPKSAPRASEIQLDASTVVFAVGCSLFAALLFGLAPILHARKSDLHGALKDGARSMTSSKARLRARRTLVIVEIALAMLLVIGCTVMVRSFMRLSRVELGMQPDRLLTFGITLPLKAYQPAAANQFWDRLEDRLRALPAIEGAVLIDTFGVDRTINASSFSIPGRARLPIGPAWNTDYLNLGGADYVKVQGGRILRGRDIAASDVDGAPRVVIVNKAFAKKFFPNDDPIGKEVIALLTGPDTEKPQRIVGVFADMKNAGVDKPAGTEIVMPRMQYGSLLDPPLAAYTHYGVIRTKHAPETLIPALHRAVAEIDPSAPLYDVRTMDQLMWDAVAKPRFLTFLLSCFAGVALLLAAVGVYGVMAHTVALRTHEIGLRVALGAQPRQVRALVLRQAGVLVAAGVGVGLIVAVAVQVALDSSLRGLFYGEELSQPLLLAGVAIAVTATALLATWVPARRATRVEPTVALRSE